MYEYRPPRKNVIARLLALGLLLLSVLCFFLSAQLPPLATLFQSVGLLVLLPMVQIVARYLVLSHLYRLVPYESGEVDLEIYTYRGGDRMQLVARIGLEEITAVTPLSAANARAPRDMRRYNYAPDIRPQNAAVLSITNGDGDCEILLCPDEKLLQMLQGAVQRAASDCGEKQK